MKAKGSTSRRIGNAPHPQRPPAPVRSLAEQEDYPSALALRASEIPFGLLLALVCRVVSA